MSVRDRNAIAAASATILKGTEPWVCITDQYSFKSALGPVNFAETWFSAAAPAQRSPSELGVPSTILLTDTIDPAGDFDLFSLNVVAGETYMISVYGSGADPLSDSVIFLLDDAFGVVDLDDDGGAGTNSLLTFTAAYTGTYYIDVEAYPDSGLTGQYTLDVIQQAPVDVVPSTFDGAVLIAPGVTYGFIDSDVPDVYAFAGETDTFRIEAEAGKFYTIEVAGGADYMSDFLNLVPGELDPWVFLYGPEGELVADSDDIVFPTDISSRFSFFALEAGTYYLDVQSWAPWTGGYSITLEEVDLSQLNPLDAINWFSADNIDVGPGGVVKVYFAAAGESFGELADDGVSPLPSFGWNAHEKAQVFDALQEYSKILGFTYVETTNAAEAEFRLITTTSEQYGAYFYPQDPDFGDAQGIGAFNVDSGGWSFDVQQGLLQGGFDFAVVLHELGHAHGLAHPHDNGGGSDILAGVTGPFDSYGVYDLNQGVYTVMSYNDAWPLHPDGPSPFTAAGIDNGWSGTLSAFDIALLQQRYGIVNAYAAGNSVYTLKDVQDVGTYYETIWDTGGTDEIRYAGTRDATIDLTAATLDYSATGGGVISYVREIKGGFTIANGVVIENATAGGGDDVLIGNAAANTLTGNNGDDFLMGGLGADNLNGGNGFDTASYRNATAAVAASLAANRGTGGEANGDRYTGIEKLEGSKFNDTLDGGNGNDTLFGLAGNDRLNGSHGADTVDGGDGDDLLDGGNQNDTLSGGAGNDRLDGGNDADTLDGGDGNDVLIGGNQNDTLSGGAGNDNLDGGNDRDTLSGGAGNDTLTGGNQNDTLTGGAGDDVLDGGNDADALDGGDGNDNLTGGNQNDTLVGGAGNDTISGGNDNDWINGGAGNDILTGGNNRDQFVFGEIGGADRITDFKRGEDKVDLTLIDAVAGGGDNAFAWIGAGAFTGTAGQLRAYSQSGNFFLAGDVDGNGVADFTIQTNVLLITSDVVL